MKERFLQGTLYSAGSMIFSTLMLLVAGKFLTNTLTQEDVGHFALLLICAECLGMVANLGLPATAPKLLQALEEKARPRLLESLFALQLATALILAALCAAAAVFSRDWLPLVASWLPLPPRLFTILPVLLVAVAFRDFLLATTAGLHDYRRRAGAVAIMSSLQAITFGALFFGDTESPLPFAASQLFAVGAGATLLASTISRDGRPDWKEAFACARFSLPLFGNNILNFIYQRADTLLVAYFLGIQAVALFEMAKRIPGVLSRFFVAVLVPYLPSLTELLRKGEQARAAQLLERIATYCAFTGYAMTLGTLAVQEPLLHLLFSKDYTSAAAVLGPLLIASCLAIQAGIMGQALIALDRPLWIMVINIGLALIGIGANSILLPQIGLAGAGWSAAAAALFSYLLQRFAVASAGIVSRPDRRSLVHVYFVAAYAVVYLLQPPPWAILLVAFAFVAACGGTRVITPGELTALVRRAAP